MTMSCWCDILPLTVGVATVILTVVLVNYLRRNNKKKTDVKSPKESENSKSATTVVEKATIKTDSGHERTLIDPNEKYYLPLIEKEELSHDTRRFRFALPSAKHILGLPIGQHIHLIATINEELVIRAYTPVSSDDDLGFADLVIKVYRRGVHPKFPDGGKMSQFVDALNIGDKIAFKGPTGKLQYLGNGHFAIKKLRKDPPIALKAKFINMIAGGTGITPMLQLAREVLKRSDEQTKLSLLFANQTENDILLREELDNLSKQHPDRFKVWYTVDTVTDAWKYSKGFINDTMISENLYPPVEETIVLMCGPPPMINFACQPSLEKLGYPTDIRFAY